MGDSEHPSLLTRGSSTVFHFIFYPKFQRQILSPEQESRWSRQIWDIDILLQTATLATPRSRYETHTTISSWSMTKSKKPRTL